MDRFRIAPAARLAARALAALWLALAGLLAANAASVLPLYLDQVIDDARLAFEGTCIETHSARDPANGMVVTYTTFAVRDMLKGHAGTTHTIKQIGGSLPGEGLVYRVPGVPKFTVGEDYVVFLAGVSRSGFSSPIGLGQGKFGIRSEGGIRKVGNGGDFRELTARMSASLPPAAREKMQQAEPVREMDLDQFKQLVRGRVTGILR